MSALRALAAAGIKVVNNRIHVSDLDRAIDVVTAEASQDPTSWPVVTGNWEGYDVLPTGSTSSIAASLYEYDVWRQLRDVPYSAFDYSGNVLGWFSHRSGEEERVANLADEIKLGLDSGEGKIEPLIVAVDKDGPYILEGQHRFCALHALGYKSFPALVVIDLEDRPELEEK